MDDEIRAKTDEVIDSLEFIDGISVTAIEANEYIRGDPTDEDAVTSGAELKVTAYYSTGELPDDSNTDRFRYDP